MRELANLLVALGDGAATPTEPDALVALEERAQHDLEAARPRAAIPVRDRDAVRNDDDPAAHDGTASASAMTSSQRRTSAGQSKCLSTPESLRPTDMDWPLNSAITLKASSSV
jgi:hypothetical protein